MKQLLNKLIFLLACTCLLFVSCKKSLEVDPSRSLIPRQTVFSNDVTATSAVLGIYANLYVGSFASGSNRSITAFGGLSSDDLMNLPNTPVYTEFDENNLTASNSEVLSLWQSLYKSIYQANDIIEGLSNSSGVTETAKTQLGGEAYFIRAFAHFYLVNLFGEVPIVLSTDYKVNSTISKSPISSVYQQIISDLVLAKSKLSDTYVTTERLRPNKATAAALLSRAYLYTEQWVKAEELASEVIGNNLYAIIANLDDVFKKNSVESIWQLRPTGIETTGYVNEAFYFGPSQVANYNGLTTSLVNSFEATDKRKTFWTAGSGTVFYPTKYKQYVASATITEYSMVFRLSEQYLIRAEARAKQGNLINAIKDVDSVRKRAGLPLIVNINPGISEANLLLAIEKEKRSEFFAEWGHRWFDLKRWNRATAVLSPLKPGWTTEDQLYPLPELEMIRNQNLKPQNPGY